MAKAIYPVGECCTLCWAHENSDTFSKDFGIFAHVRTQTASPSLLLLRSSAIISLFYCCCITRRDNRGQKRRGRNPVIVF